MSKALELAKFLDVNARSKQDYEAADELRRLAAVEAELDRIRAMEPVACIQHYKGDKGRLFFVTDIDPPPGSPEYIEDVSWTLLYTLEKKP